MISFSFLGGNIYVDSGKLYSDSIEVGDGQSILRPLHATEINKKLKTRDWNIYPRKYVKDGELFIVREQSSSPALVVDSRTKGVQQSHQVENYSETFKTEFLLNYKDILDTMNNKEGEIYIYDSSKRTIDLLKSSILINVVREDSNQFTTTADLGDILITGFDGKIDLSLRYTKGGDIYNYSITLPTSSDTSAGNSDIEIEYKGRVLSAFPKNKNVDECIINSLQVTYGLL